MISNRHSPLLAPQTGVARLAYWVSQVASPPVLVTIATVLSVAAAPSASGWWCAALYISLTVIVPCVYIIRLVRQGKAADFHLPNRQERVRPLQVTLALTAIAWLLLLAVHAPLLLQVVALANLAQALLFFFITFYWKISLHCAAAAGLAVLSVYVGGRIALPVVIGVPLVAWSRLYLRRHTLSQTCMGALVGGALFIMAAIYLQVQYQ